MLHFRGPFQEPPKVVALPPEKFDEFEHADLVHFHAGIGFDPPQEIGAAPGREAMPASGIPEEPEHVTHHYIIEVASGW